MFLAHQHFIVNTSSLLETILIQQELQLYNICLHCGSSVRLRKGENWMNKHFNCYRILAQQHLLQVSSQTAAANCGEGAWHMRWWNQRKARASQRFNRGVNALDWIMFFSAKFVHTTMFIHWLCTLVTFSKQENFLGGLFACLKLRARRPKPPKPRKFLTVQ